MFFSNIKKAIFFNLFFVNNRGTLQEQGVAHNLEYRIGRSRSSVALDVNGDGRLDLVQFTALRKDGKGDSAYFEQKPDGTFKAPVSLNLGASSRYGQLADLNGDGSIDESDIEKFAENQTKEVVEQIYSQACDAPITKDWIGFKAFIK